MAVHNWAVSGVQHVERNLGVTLIRFVMEVMTGTGSWMEEPFVLRIGAAIRTHPRGL